VPDVISVANSLNQNLVGGVNPQTTQLIQQSNALDSFIRGRYYEDRSAYNKRSTLFQFMDILQVLKKKFVLLKTIISKHMHQDIEKLGGKIDKIYWVLLAAVGSVAMFLVKEVFFK
jgi:hypothetical protein